MRSPFFRDKVKRFLEANGLRMESLDSYYAIEDASGNIVAGAGLSGEVLKCLAVSPEVRSEGLLAPLVSRIMSEHAGPSFKVFTKPEYQPLFESMGFRLLAQAPLAVLLEKGKGLEAYCTYLRSFRREGTCGVVVMNANPFTLGHLYLLEQASARVDHLFVIPVKEDVSAFSYEERRAMICAGVGGLTVSGQDITVLEGSDYVISAATFPTYFLKDLSTAAETQMQLDVDLYDRWIAPALGATVRFVGSEPLDALTNRYNQLITNPTLIERLCIHGEVVSASRVRRALKGGFLSEAVSLCPVSTRAYLLAALADQALRRELDTPLKPGLVCPDTCGAHRDMDYSTMRAGITALRPWWPRMALAASARELMELGIEAEKAMLAATDGVNTHRGAIFCMGIALNALESCLERDVEGVEFERVMKNLSGKIAGEIFDIQLKDRKLRITLSGARKMAADGYAQLWADWLPYYRSGAGEQKTLLRIMSTLDDTCVVHRVGKKRAQEVKREAAELLKGKGELADCCRRYAAEGISPGGSADMLALTIFFSYTNL